MAIPLEKRLWGAIVEANIVNRVKGPSRLLTTCYKGCPGCRHDDGGARRPNDSVTASSVKVQVGKGLL